MVTKKLSAFTKASKANVEVGKKNDKRSNVRKSDVSI